MIVVKIELWRFGEESNKELLEEIHIVNDGTGDHVKGNYEFYTTINEREGKIKRFLRKRGVLTLVNKVIFNLEN